MPHPARSIYLNNRTRMTHHHLLIIIAYFQLFCILRWNNRWNKNVDMRQRLQQLLQISRWVSAADVYRLLTSPLIEQEQAHFQTTDWPLHFHWHKATDTSQPQTRKVTQCKDDSQSSPLHCQRSHWLILQRSVLHVPTAVIPTGRPACQACVWPV
jgi:hypothetical protein